MNAAIEPGAESPKQEAHTCCCAQNEKPRGCRSWFGRLIATVGLRSCASLASGKCACKATSFLVRESQFLKKPLNAASRLLLLFGALLIGASLFFPLWHMRLVAPQYQEGLNLDIYTYKILGGGLGGHDIEEINNLNHYIGMKPILAADFVEMQWMPFVFGIIILLTLRSVVFGQMGNVVDVFAIYTYFGVFSISSFAYRLYTYGHHLDPHAPVHIKPFTPLLVGAKQIANFKEYSYPQAGAYLLLASVAAIMLAMWFSRREKPI